MVFLLIISSPRVPLGAPVRPVPASRLKVRAIARPKPRDTRLIHSIREINRNAHRAPEFIDVGVRFQLMRISHARVRISR
jgi:hypothetical protein